jgi:hypothetical protein
MPFCSNAIKFPVCIPQYQVCVYLFIYISIWHMYDQYLDIYVYICHYQYVHAK